MPDVVFGPLHPAGFAVGHGRRQAEHAFIKLPRPRHVGDGVATERDFGDLEHMENLRTQGTGGTEVGIAAGDWQAVDGAEADSSCSPVALELFRKALF